jgi:hypothetical protein
MVAKSDFFATVGYKPHEQQWLYHNSAARFRVPTCGRRFGKSTMAGRDLEPKLFEPKKRFWIVGPTYDLGEKEFRVIWDDLIVGQQLGRDKRVKKSYNKRSGEMYIEFPWQTRLEVRSADHPENLVGEALDWVVMSEAAKHKEETWERFIRPALADKRGGADFPTTPEGFNWLYQLWMLGKDQDVPEYESWRFPSWANSVVYPDGEDDAEIQLLKRTMMPERFNQEIAADFSSFVGKIYPEWNDDVHVENVRFHPEWPNYITFDWGYTNPLAAIEFQVSPSDEVYIWREHYKAYATLHEHIDMLKQREQPEGYHLDMAFGDAADPEAVETVSQYLVGCIGDPKAKENWRQGIDLVRSFMQTIQVGILDEFGTPMERTRLHVDVKCKNTIHEFNNYRAPDSVKGKNVQEIGLRQDDHALDAIRYGLVHVFKLGAVYHLDDVYGDQSVARAPELVAAGRNSSGSLGDVTPRHTPSFDFDVSEGGFFTSTGGVF